MDVAQLSIAVDSTGVTGATRAMDDMSAMGSKLHAIVQKVAAAWAGWKVIEYAKDSAILAARYETLGVVMQVAGNNAGYTGAKMLELEQGLQKAGISMVSSREALTSMATANLDLAKSSQLARAAQDVAVVGNINSSEAFQKMVRGIKSGEVEILRTMGLNVQFEAGYKTLAASMHKNMDQLSSQEKIQSRMNTALEAASRYTGIYEASMTTAGKQLLSMQRYAEDLQVVFGAVFSDAMGTMVQALNQALQDTKKWLVENAESAASMRDNLGSAAKNFVGLVTDTLSSLSGAVGQFELFNEKLTIGEILAGGVALAMAAIRDMAVAGIATMTTFWGAIATMISGSIYGATKLFGMILGFQPPAWMKTFYEKTTGMMGAWGNVANNKRSAVSDFYTGKKSVWDMVNDDEIAAAKKKNDEAEATRIALAETTRANEAAKAAADARAASAAVAYATALKYKVDVMKWEAEAYDKNAEAASKYADAGIKDNLTLQDFVTSLQPAKVEAEKMAQVRYDLGWALAEEIINQQEYNELLGLAAIKYTEAGQAAEDYKKKLNSDVDRMNQRDDYGTRLARINEANATGRLTAEAYNREMKKLGHDTTTIWGQMQNSIESFADNGASALASFFNGTKTGFRDMVSSMLIDMEKLILKEQVMKPLLSGITGFNWGSMFGSNVSSAGSDFFTAGAASGGYRDGSKPYLVGELGPEIFNPGVAGTITPNHALGGGVTNNVQVYVSTDGQTKTKGGGGDMRQFGQMIGAKCREVLVQESRSGGLLNPV